MSNHHKKSSQILDFPKSGNERQKVTEFLKESYEKGGGTALAPRSNVTAAGTTTATASFGSVQTALKHASKQDGLLKPGYSRSAVTYIERDDPKNKHCEQVVFTLNLSAQEMQYPISGEASETQKLEDGRSLQRFCWDSAVNSLVESLSKSGMRPRSLKNDRNTCKVTMQKEYLVAGDVVPDEFYTLEMEYMSQGELESRKIHYVRTLARFAMDIEERKQRVYDRWTTENARKRLLADIATIETKKAAFIASNPDPRELDSGIVLHVEVSTTKEYQITKNAIQGVLTEFIDSLSRVASGHVRLVLDPSNTSAPSQNTVDAQVSQIAQAFDGEKKAS